MVIDPTTDLGKVRLRCGDFGDIPWLPDTVYTQAITDSSGNLSTASKTCATYILGMLAFKTHRKMGLQLENWAGEAFTHYKEFLLMTVTNPAFMDLSPIPYATTSDKSNSLALFQESWNRNFTRGTEDQQLNTNALYSPNEGGPYDNSCLYSSEGY